MRILCVLALAAGRLAFAAGIENANCDQTGPTTYRIEFQAPANAGPIAIFASAHSDRVDSQTPLTTTRTSPVEVTVPAATGRVYFHLKPQSGPERVVSIRHLPIEGAANFRDLGGYRTADGHYVRWGVIYRSNNLSALTPRDYEYVAGLGIHLVCDFRVDSERQRSPTKWQGSAAPEIVPESIDTIKFLTAANPRESGFTSVYQNLPLEGIAQFGDVLNRLVKGELPTLVHCTAGKDRTGVFSALLLTALGVPRETVQADYELSNRYLLPEEKPGTNPADRLTLERRSGVDPAWLDVAFKAIDAKYGSFDMYLHGALGITDADLAELRKRLLED